MSKSKEKKEKMSPAEGYYEEVCQEKKKGARILIFESNNKRHPASHFPAIEAKQEINFPLPYS